MNRHGRVFFKDLVQLPNDQKNLERARGAIDPFAPPLPAPLRTGLKALWDIVLRILIENIFNVNVVTMNLGPVHFGPLSLGHSRLSGPKLSGPK